MYYLVTELATGGDLCTHIKEQPAGKLDENMARLYTRQLVAALKHMHSKGVVHRWVTRILTALYAQIFELYSRYNKLRKVQLNSLQLITEEESTCEKIQICVL